MNKMPSFKIHLIDVQNSLQNYIWILEDTKTHDIVVIDPTESQIVIDYCESHYLKVKQIWVTHWHKDHIAGIPKLLEKYKNVPVYGPKAEASHIPTLSHFLNESDIFHFNCFEVNIIATPGHTLGHIVFYIPEIGCVFVGDTLFAMGCGRVFEGTHKQMYESLQRLASLPDNTEVYSTHEYTLSNAKFAVTLEPDNFLLEERAEHVEYLRLLNKPTLPTTIALEKATNPFMRAKSIEQFSQWRTRKDNA